MLTTQRWSPDTCHCAFNQAADDGLPDDVLPGTEKARPFDKKGYHEVNFITRLEGEAIKQQRRDRIAQVVKRVKIDYNEGVITEDEAYDCFYSRQKTGKRGYDEDELAFVAKVNDQRARLWQSPLTPETIFALIAQENRRKLRSFLNGNEPPQPCSGITDDQLEPNTLCPRHEELSPREAYEHVLQENAWKNTVG